MKVFLSNLKATLLSKWKIIIGLCSISFGISCVLCGTVFWDDILNRIIKKEMVLSPDSQFTNRWISPSMDIYLDVYLFNWLNPQDFNNPSIRPIFQEMGPYRFLERSQKVDIQWHPENASVSYRKRHLYYFDAAGSAGSLSDNVTTLNILPLTAAAKAKYWNDTLQKTVNMGIDLYSPKYFISKTVDELLFTGYNDILLDIALTMSVYKRGLHVSTDKFGWLYKHNVSSETDGVFNVHTGARTGLNVGQMHSWNYKTHIEVNEANCGRINGSSGEFYPRHLETNRSISIFMSDFCRSIPLDYNETVKIERLEGYKYIASVPSDDNGSLYPENDCLCGGKCVPPGAMNVTSCRSGASIFVSFPHFYNADPSYLQKLKGLTPDASKHQFYIVVEPRTGVSLEIAARFQVNVLVEPMKKFNLLKKVPEVFFPIIWYEQKIRISPETAHSLKVLFEFSWLLQIIGSSLFVLGLLLVCWQPATQLYVVATKSLNQSQNVAFRRKSTSRDNTKDSSM